MCGIAGLFSKSGSIEEELGAHLSAMLSQLADRGPDSAGVALYRDPAPAGACKVSLFSPRAGAAVARARRGAGRGVRGRGRAGGSGLARAVRRPGRPRPRFSAWLADRHPELRVMSVGERIEIYKEAVDPRDFVERFGLADVSATHALGHTRMATESRVTTEHSHPFSTGLDLCLVHNGSLSNHNRLRAVPAPPGDRVPDRQRHRGRGRLPDLAPVRGRRPRAGAARAASTTSTASTPSRSARPTASRSCGTRSRASPRCWPRPTTGSRWPRSTGRSPSCPGPRTRSSGSPSRAACTHGSARGSRERRRAWPSSRSTSRPTSVRELNQRLHDLDPGARRDGGSQTRTAPTRSPSGSTPTVEVEIDGHVGYYCAGMNKLATVRVAGNCGVGVAENIMSGTVIVEGDASQSAGASGRGGPAGDQGQRLGALRDLDEGRRHRRPRLGRSRRRVHGAAGDARRLRRRRARISATRSTRRGCTSAARSPAWGRTASRRRWATSTAPSSAELLERAEADADPGDFRRYGSARQLYTFHVDNAGAY